MEIITTLYDQENISLCQKAPSLFGKVLTPTAHKKRVDPFIEISRFQC